MKRKARKGRGGRFAVTIDVIIEDDRWAALGIEALAAAADIAVLAKLGLTDADPATDMLACDDTRIAQLNTDFRDKPTATNVLSWPAEELRAEHAGAMPKVPRAQMGEISLGDIAIAYETCQREAAEQNKHIDAHVTHLIVHGMLHLLGYDHIRDQDATLMEGMERDILGNMGYDDPYRT